MAKTINGITFNNLSRLSKGSAFGNVRNPEITSEADLQDYIDAGEEYRNIQSVLIDWNGAQVQLSGVNSSRTINTTGDLLSWIKEGIEEAAVSGRTSGVVRRSLWIN